MISVIQIGLVLRIIIVKKNIIIVVLWVIFAYEFSDLVIMHDVYMN